MTNRMKYDRVPGEQVHEEDPLLAMAMTVFAKGMIKTGGQLNITTLAGRGNEVLFEMFDALQGGAVEADEWLLERAMDREVDAMVFGAIACGAMGTPQGVDDRDRVVIYYWRRGRPERAFSAAVDDVLFAGQVDRSIGWLEHVTRIEIVEPGRLADYWNRAEYRRISGDN